MSPTARHYCLWRMAWRAKTGAHKTARWLGLTLKDVHKRQWSVDDGKKEPNTFKGYLHGGTYFMLRFHDIVEAEKSLLRFEEYLALFF